MMHLMTFNFSPINVNEREEALMMKSSTNDYCSFYVLHFSKLAKMIHSDIFLDVEYDMCHHFHTNLIRCSFRIFCCLHFAYLSDFQSDLPLLCPAANRVFSGIRAYRSFQTMSCCVLNHCDSMFGGHLVLEQCFCEYDIYSFPLLH